MSRDNFKKSKLTSNAPTTIEKSNDKYDNLKTNRQLSIALGSQKGLSDNDLREYIEQQNISLEYYNKVLDVIKSIAKNEKELVEIRTKFNLLLTKSKTADEEVVKKAWEQLEAEQKILEAKSKQEKVQQSLKKLAQDIGKEYQKLVSYNQEIYKISHELQLESNIAWKEFSKIYTQAYQDAREFNNQLGKSLLTSKELLGMVNILSKSGWKNINAGDLVEISTSVYALQRTLGSFPQELNATFQQAYRQFGSATSEFVMSMGDRLNTFSKSFNVSVEALSHSIADMMAMNTFMLRGNQQAQIQANENLLKATALASNIGLTSVDRLTDIAKTSQMGTASEVARLYQGGALLQGFDTQQFRADLNTYNYDTAFRNLFEAIGTTLRGVNEPYLRAEYIDKLSSSFGFTEDQLLMIATNADKLDEYSRDLQNKLLDTNGSMLDELKDYKVAWADRWEAWVSNTPLSQTIGEVYNELGLYGIREKIDTVVGLLGSIQATLIAMKGADYLKSSGKSLGDLFSFGTKLGSDGLLKGVGAGTKALGFGAGIGVAGLSNYAMHNKLIDPYASTGERIGAGIGGTLLSGVGGALAGASVGNVYGAIIGGVIGLGAGVVNAITSDLDRRDNIRNIQSSLEQSRISRTVAQTQSTDPVVNAINDLKITMVDVVESTSDKAIKNDNINRTIDSNNRLRGLMWDKQGIS